MFFGAGRGFVGFLNACVDGWMDGWYVQILIDGEGDGYAMLMIWLGFICGFWGVGCEGFFFKGKLRKIERFIKTNHISFPPLKN